MMFLLMDLAHGLMGFWWSGFFIWQIVWVIGVNMTMNQRKFFEFEEGRDFIQNGFTKLKRIIEGLPEPEFSPGEYLELYTYPLSLSYIFPPCITLTKEKGKRDYIWQNEWTNQKELEMEINYVFIACFGLLSPKLLLQYYIQHVQPKAPLWLFSKAIPDV